MTTRGKVLDTITPENKSSAEPYLGFLFDFNLTLTEEHTEHKYKNTMTDSQVYFNVKPFVKTALQAVLNKNHRLKILSENATPSLIERHLRASELTSKEISKIPIILGKKVEAALDSIVSWCNDEKRNNRKLTILYLDEDDSCITNILKKIIFDEWYLNNNIEFLSIPSQKSGLDNHLKAVKDIVSSTPENSNKILAELRQNNQIKIEEIKRERIEIENKDKVQAFQKIYQALYDGETTFWKSKSFLKGKENLSYEQMLQEITTHKNNKPHSRTQVAWQLAEKYKNNCSNIALFKEIHNKSYSKSGLFRQTRTIDAIFASFDELDKHSKGSRRTAKICHALRS